MWIVSVYLNSTYDAWSIKRMQICIVNNEGHSKIEEIKLLAGKLIWRFLSWELLKPCSRLSELNKTRGRNEQLLENLHEAITLVRNNSENKLVVTRKKNPKYYNDWDNNITKLECKWSILSGFKYMHALMTIFCAISSCVCAVFTPMYL